MWMDQGVVCYITCVCSGCCGEHRGSQSLSVVVSNVVCGKK